MDDDHLMHDEWGSRVQDMLEEAYEKLYTYAIYTECVIYKLWTAAIYTSYTLAAQNKYREVDDDKLTSARWMGQ